MSMPRTRHALPAKGSPLVSTRFVAFTTDTLTEMIAESVLTVVGGCSPPYAHARTRVCHRIRIRSAPPAVGEIRRLTILFADPVDSTALSTVGVPETYRTRPPFCRPIRQLHQRSPACDLALRRSQSRRRTAYGCDCLIASTTRLLVFARSERHCLRAKAFEHCKMRNPRTVKVSAGMVLQVFGLRAGWDFEEPFGIEVTDFRFAGRADGQSVKERAALTVLAQGGVDGEQDPVGSDDLLQQLKGRAL